MNKYVAGTGGNVNSSTLIDQLTKNYHSILRPVCEEDLPVQVKIGLAIRQIIDLVSHLPRELAIIRSFRKLVCRHYQSRRFSHFPCQDNLRRKSIFFGGKKTTTVNHLLACTTDHRWRTMVAGRFIPKTACTRSISPKSIFIPG